MKKNAGRNLQYGPRTWLVRGIQLFQLTLSDQRFKPTQKDRMVV